MTRTRQQPPQATAPTDSLSVPGRCLGALLALVLLTLNLVAASPVAHHEVHCDADHPDHSCAITLAAAGFCDTTAPLPAAVSQSVAVSIERPPPVAFRWSVPLHWHAPAHAPPRA